MTESKFSPASFYRLLEEGKLMGSRCQKCQALYLPPRPICLKCHSADMDWVQMEGRGKIVTFTTVAVGTSPMVEEGYDRNRHYCSGVVELEEGPRVSAHILGVDAQNPESIKIGTPVTVEPLKRQDKPTILAFRAE